MRPGRRGRRRAAALALTGTLLVLPALTGCASSADPVDSIERLGRRAAEGVAPRAPAPPGERVRVGRAVVEGKPVERAGVRTADREGRRCRKAPEPRTTVPPVTPRSDELALRLTEC